MKGKVKTAKRVSYTVLECTAPKIEDAVYNEEFGNYVEPKEGDLWACPTAISKIKIDDKTGKTKWKLYQKGGN